MPLLEAMPREVVGLTVLHGTLCRPPAQPSDSEVDSSELDPVLLPKALSADSVSKSRYRADREECLLKSIHLPWLTVDSDVLSEPKAVLRLALDQILLFQPAFPAPKPPPIEPGRDRSLPRTDDELSRLCRGYEMGLVTSVTGTLWSSPLTLWQLDPPLDPAPIIDAIWSSKNMLWLLWGVYDASPRELSCCTGAFETCAEDGKLVQGRYFVRLANVADGMKTLLLPIPVSRAIPQASAIVEQQPDSPLRPRKGATSQGDIWTPAHKCKTSRILTCVQQTTKAVRSGRVDAVPMGEYRHRERATRVG